VTNEKGGGTIGWGKQKHCNPKKGEKRGGGGTSNFSVGLTQKKHGGGCQKGGEGRGICDWGGGELAGKDRVKKTSKCDKKKKHKAVEQRGRRLEASKEMLGGAPRFGINKKLGVQLRGKKLVPVSLAKKGKGGRGRAQVYPIRFEKRKGKTLQDEKI